MSLSAIAQSSSIALVDSTEPTPRELRWVLDTASGQPWIEGRLYVGGVHRSTFIRVKQSNSAQRIAADFPGCDPNYVIVDSNGHITNG